jgi:hypothetical protein
VLRFEILRKLRKKLIFLIFASRRDELILSGLDNELKKFNKFKWSSFVVISEKFQQFC